MRALITAVAVLTITLAGCAEPPHPDTKVDCRLRAPAYPAVSRARGDTGMATVKFAVDEDGKITSVAIAKSSGHAELDEAALSAMRSSTCKPLYKGGKRVPFTYSQPYHFALRQDP